jgi:hypothetical protein
LLSFIGRSDTTAQLAIEDGAPQTLGTICREKRSSQVDELAHEFCYLSCLPESDEPSDDLAKCVPMLMAVDDTRMLSTGVVEGYEIGVVCEKDATLSVSVG